MVVRRTCLVRILAPGGAPGPWTPGRAAGDAILVVRREIDLDGQGCSLTLRPLLEAGPYARRPVPATIRPFSLTVRGAKARFDRDLRLPPPWRGLGLGTYFLATLVRLAVLLGHGQARVRALHLVARDHAPLRTAFYLGMGFRLTLWPDGTGFARADRLADLRRTLNPAKVVESWGRDPGAGLLLPPAPAPLTPAPGEPLAEAPAPV